MVASLFIWFEKRRERGDEEQFKGWIFLVCKRANDAAESTAESTADESAAESAAVRDVAESGDVDSAALVRRALDQRGFGSEFLRLVERRRRRRRRVFGDDLSTRLR